LDRKKSRVTREHFRETCGYAPTTSPGTGS